MTSKTNVALLLSNGIYALNADFVNEALQQGANPNY
jgi:hypothetical protein